MNLIPINQSQGRPLKVVEASTAYLSRETFDLYPHMPQKQISHCLKQAYQKQATVIIQINPQTKHPFYLEVTGKIKMDRRSKQLLVFSDDHSLSYLLKPRTIRHVRLLQYKN